MLLLLVGIVVVVVIELVAYRAYKAHKARKAERFTKEHLGEVYDDVVKSLLYESEASRLFEGLHETGLSGAEEAGDVLLAIGKGKSIVSDGFSSVLAELGERRPPDRREAARQAVGEDDLRTFESISQTWAYEVYPEMSKRAKKAGYSALAKRFKQAGEVESCHLDLVGSLLEGRVDTASEVSLCPTCGALYFGRRPAACLVCTHPTYEMEQVRKGRLD